MEGHYGALQPNQISLLSNKNNVPWYISNDQIHSDLQISFVKDEVTKLSICYQQLFESNLNPLARALISDNTDVHIDED